MKKVPELPPALRRFFASAFCMDGGFYLIMAAIPFKVLALGGGSVDLGLAAALGSVTYIATTPLAGHWSDRSGRRWLCLAGCGALIAFAGLAQRTSQLTLLLLLIPIMGVGKALYWPLVEAAVADLSGGGRLERHLNSFNVAWCAGKSVGFLASGLLLAHTGFSITFLAGSLLVVAAFLTLPPQRSWPVGAVAPAATTATAGLASDRFTGQTGTAIPGKAASDRFSDTGRQGISPSSFRRMAWSANLAAYGVLGILTYQLPKWLDQLGWDAGRFGLVLGGILLAQMLVFLLLGTRPRFAFSRRWLLLPQFAAAAALVALPWLRSYGLLLCLTPLLGLSFGVSYAASIFHSLHTDSGKGLNAGIHESLIGVGGFLPPLLAGLVASWSGWLGAPYLLAAGCIAVALCFQILLGTDRAARTTALRAP